MISKSTVLFLLVLSALGCYEVKQDEKGRTIKINKLTGELSVIDGDKIVRLRTESEVRAENEATERLSSPKQWPPIKLTVADSPTVTLMTKWSEGTLYYQFFVDKNVREKATARAQFTIQLEDNASFVLEEIIVPVSSMIGVVGEEKKISSLDHKGHKPMTDKQYLKLVRWNVAWAGFSE